MRRNASVFDQRGQTVTSQYNAAGNIDIESAQRKEDLLEHIRFLRSEADEAATRDVLTCDQSRHIKCNLEKAACQLAEPNLDRRGVVAYLSASKDILGGIGAAAGLAEAISQCIDKVKALL